MCVARGRGNCNHNCPIHHYILPIKWSDYIGIILQSLIEGFLVHRPWFTVLLLWDSRACNSKVSSPNCACALRDLGKCYTNFYFIEHCYLNISVNKIYLDPMVSLLRLHI